MTSISSNYTLNQVRDLNTKTKVTNNNVNISSPIEHTNVNFKGTEALAAYNYALVNKDNLFNLPIIKPLDIPTNPDNISGEKIYNSAGELVRIIKDNDNQKETYYFRNNELHHYLKNEKDSKIQWEMYFSNGKFEGISKILPNKIEYFTGYENGIPVQVDKHKVHSDGDNYEHLSYLPKEKEYSISKYYTKNGHKYSSFARYDENKKCIDAFESRGMHDKITDLHFKDGVPYYITTTESKALSNTIGKDDIDLSNLTPSPFYNVDLDKIKNLEGEKKYYSNGELEQIITPEGDIYKFEPEGFISEIKSKDKEIQFHYEYETGPDGSHNIIEKLSDGATKKTQYGKTPQEGFDVWYEKENFSKYVTYNEQKNIVNYFESLDNKSIKSREYDSQGNLIRVWDEN
jgi:hypothetical protein